MLRSISRQLKPIQYQISSYNLTALSMRNATLLFEMRSGRVGSVKIESQKEFDKMLERTGSMGLVAEDSPDGEEEVQVVTKVEDIDKEVVYQLVYAADEAEGYDDKNEIKINRSLFCKCHDIMYPI